MRKLAILCFSLTAVVVCAVSHQNPGSPGKKSSQVTLEYMGAAGWTISDGTTVILIDPYVSRIVGPPPPLTPPYSRLPGDTRPVYGWDDTAVPDLAAIQTHASRADFILVTHTHYDHVLDVPQIALKTHCTVIGTESTENVLRAYGVPEQQLITVRGGEDYAFEGFSVRVIPSLHSSLDHKHYFSSETAPAGMKAPLTLRQMHPEGGTLAFLIRFHGYQILAFGGMNYIEREIQGLEPDVVLVGAAPSRKEIYDYTGRLMRVLNFPPLCFRHTGTTSSPLMVHLSSLPWRRCDPLCKKFVRLHPRRR